VFLQLPLLLEGDQAFGALEGVLFVVNSEMVVHVAFLVKGPLAALEAANVDLLSVLAISCGPHDTYLCPGFLAPAWKATVILRIVLIAWLFSDSIT